MSKETKIDFLPANALKKAFSEPKAWEDFFKKRASMIAYNNKLAAFTLKYWADLYKKIIANPKAGYIHIYYEELKSMSYSSDNFLKALGYCAGQYVNVIHSQNRSNHSNYNKANVIHYYHNNMILTDANDWE